MRGSHSRKGKEVVMMPDYDVLAIGELNVDIICTGVADMPVLGRETIVEGCRMALGGSTAITASGLAGLGLRTGFIGKVGADKFGAYVQEELERNGVRKAGIMEERNLDTGVTISLSAGADRALVTYLGSIGSLALHEIDSRLLEKTRHIHIGSYFLQNSLRRDIAPLFKQVKSRGVTTSLDTGWDVASEWDYGLGEVLEYTDVFLPNEAEALHITGKKNIYDALEVLSRSCGIAVIKRGALGAVGRSGSLVVEKKAFAVKPLDTTGAGDSFNAGFIYGFINGFDLGRCIVYGNACGAFCVTKAGGASACPTLTEIEGLISSV
ncbi:MAG: carbohydrate kinase family protein [Bacillota bacterium]